MSSNDSDSDEREGAPVLSIDADYHLVEEFEKFVICLTGKDQREAAYGRARMVLKAEMEKLVISHGWTLHVSSGGDLFHISKRKDGGQNVHFRLPLEFSSFYNNRDLYRIFNPVVKRLSDNNIDLTISEDEPPLVKIFYILQVLAPGFLKIVYCYNLDADYEVVWERAFPTPQWMEENEEMLVHILGGYDAGKYDGILHAASLCPPEPSYLPL